MPELELIGAAPSNYVWTCHIALAGDIWMPAAARSERAA